MRRVTKTGRNVFLILALCVLLCPCQVFSGDNGKAGTTYKYTVKKGDTLWDICRDKYNDPWVWPKLWEINPQIENPHWIYPGDLLSIYYQKPAAVPVPKKPAFPKLFLEYPIVNNINFVSTPQEEAGFGTIVAGRKDQKELLGQEDLIYVEFPEGVNVQVGQQFQTFATIASFDHPVTGKTFGNLNKVTGIIQILEKAKTCYIAKINKSYSEAQRGQGIRPLPVRFSRILLTPGEKSVNGYIVYCESNLIGDHQMVYIDAGRNQGVKIGNYFEIMREEVIPKREIAGHTTGFPPYKVGELIVLDVQQNSATALVLKSSREIEAGDVVRLLTKGELMKMFGPSSGATL